MTDSNNNRKLILASASPRRSEILGSAGIEFHIIVADVDEDALLPGPDSLSDAVQRVALAKAEAAAGFAPGAYVLGADTIVVLDGHVLGKPGSPGHAVEMLHRIGGRAHDVITGVAVVGPDGESHTDFVKTSVLLREFEDVEITDYVATGSPLDKAGGYGIQDSSFSPVKSYGGCYLNVVGLPMCATSELLENTGLLPNGTVECHGHGSFDAIGTKAP